MGCIISVIKKLSGLGDGNTADSAGTEMTSQEATPIAIGQVGAGVCVTEGAARGVYNIAGEGVACAADAVEQDRSYWEVRIAGAGEFGLGVCHKQEEGALKDVSLLASGADGIFAFKSSASAEAGEDYFRVGDVIGVAVDHSDLPMLSFYKKGEKLEEFSVPRVKGTVYPCVSVGGGGGGGGGGASPQLEMIFNPRCYHSGPPRGFLPLMKTVSIV